MSSAISIPEMRPDGSFTTRTETLLKYAAQAVVRREMLEDARSREYILRDTHRKLREHVERDLEKQGRMPHGEIAYSTVESVMHNDLVFRAEVMTRESDQGEWPSIWAAYHEGEEDRRDALRHPADDVGY